MILTFIKNLIADRISKSWEEQTYEENKTLAIIGKLLNPENLKRLGIIAIVGVIIFTLIKRWSEIHTYRAAISAEIPSGFQVIAEGFSPKIVAYSRQQAR